MADEIGKEWLSTLKVGSRVVVKTRIRSYDRVVELIEDSKIWVIYPIDKCSSSAISVDLDTGRNDKLGMFIFPFLEDKQYEPTRMA